MYNTPQFMSHYHPAFLSFIYPVSMPSSPPAGTHWYCKAEMPYVALTSLRLTGPQRLSCGLPHTVGKAPLLASSPVSWTGCTPLGPHPAGFTSLTACVIIQTSPSHPPGEPRCPPLPLLLIVLLSAVLGGPVWCVVPPSG